MNSRHRNRIHALMGIVGLVLGCGLVFNIADSEVTEDSADAYWAHNVQLTSGVMSTGTLLENLQCVDSGQPAAGQGQNGVNINTVEGANAVALIWENPPPANYYYQVKITLTGDGGYELATNDWNIGLTYYAPLGCDDGSAWGNNSASGSTITNNDGWHVVCSNPNTVGSSNGNTSSMTTVPVSINGTEYQAYAALGPSNQGWAGYPYTTTYLNPNGAYTTSGTTVTSVAGLNAVLFGLNIGTTGSTRTVTGTVTIEAYGPGGISYAASGGGMTTTGNPWLATSSTYAWSITYPPSGNTGGSTTCTLQSQYVDISSGPDMNQLQGTGIQGGTFTDASWSFDNVIPGESYARSIVIANTGTEAFTLGATIQAAASTGLLTSSTTYSGDVTGLTASSAPTDSSAVAQNTVTDVTALTPTSNSSTGDTDVSVYGMRTGTCAASGTDSLGNTQAGTSQVTNVSTTPTPASVLGPSTITMQPGDVITMCFVFELDSSAANSLQGATDTDSAGNASLTVNLTAN